MPPKDPKIAARQLLDYCVANDWAGYDPYDALNSKLFEALPVLNNRIPRLVLTQLLKRSPWNVRSLLQIPKTQNSKGLGIMISALIKLTRSGMLNQPELILSLADKLAAMRSPDMAQWCWGYSFPWQTRTIVVPRGAPNAVCTIFVASSLLDLFEHTRDEKYLAMAASAAEYVRKLIWSGPDGVVSLSYPLATQRSLIHNANFLGAALFCRIQKLARKDHLLEPALKLARYSARAQKPDGSWPYGELPTQQWVDNFHTGYNLSGLRTIGQALGTSEFEPCVKRGFEFYRTHFFTSEATPRYFHDRTYPVDSHCVAQSILTLLEFQDLDSTNIAQAHRVFDWAMTNLWDDEGYFYYRRLPFMRIKTSYMRWVQAWMLLSVATLVEDDEKRSAGKPVNGSSKTNFGPKPVLEVPSTH
jgi:hypothetical protein